MSTKIQDMEAQIPLTSPKSSSSTASPPDVATTPFLSSKGGDGEPLVTPQTPGKSPKPMIRPAWNFQGSKGTPPSSPSPTGTNKRLAFTTDNPSKAHHSVTVTLPRTDNNTVTSIDSSLYRNTLTSNNNNEHTHTSTVDSTTFRKIRNRMSSKYGRMRKRVIFKNGDCNLHQTNISKKGRKYLADIFVTLVDLQVSWEFSWHEI